MSKEMKLIMENWRSFVLHEEEQGPQTVGELLKVFDAMIDMEYLKSNLLQTLFKYTAMATGEDSTLDDNQKAIIENLEEFLNALSSGGLMVFIRGGMKWNAIKAGFEVLLSIPIVQKELGKAAAFILEQIVPGLSVLLKGLTVIKTIYGAVKDAAAILKASGDPQKKLDAIIQKIATAEDSKETTSGFLKHFNIDDRWSKLLDDKVEAVLINNLYKSMKRADSSSLLADVDFNKKMLAFIKDDSLYQGLPQTQYSPSRTVK